MGVLEHSIREELNLTAKRVMGVLDPLKITITNYPKNENEKIFAPNNPNNNIKKLYVIILIMFVL